MKRDEQNVRNILDGFLNRFGEPPNAKMESAGERVLLQLKLQSPEATEVVRFSDREVFEPVSVRPFWKLPLFAAAVFVFAVVAPAMLLRNLVWQAADGARKVEFGETVRTNDKAGTVIALPDGSRVEMRSRSELMLERADDGLRIQLRRGSVIVTAAKQGIGHLYVQTKDVTVSVIGTVFLVNAEEAGSRVAVIQGEVHVQQGAVLKKLLPGQQVATNPMMQTLPVIEEIQWSRNVLAHVSLLQQALVAPPVAQSPAPQFDVVSIKPCPPGGGFMGTPGVGVGRGGGGGRGPRGSSPGGLNLTCTPLGNTLEQLIRQAYLTYANGQRNSPLASTVTIEGGPVWLTTDRYEILARAEGNPSVEMMKGPMLQALLEDRFKLRIHRETRDVPVYAMTVLKSGLKVQPLEEGSCDRLDLADPPANRPIIMTPDVFKEILQPGQKPGCEMVGLSALPGGTNQAVHAQAMSLSQFASVLSRGMDRVVSDKTGVTGIFNFHLKFAIDATVRFFPPAHAGLAPPTPPDIAAEPAGPSIFTALEEQLGLKLDRARGPGEFIVIDQVEKPSRN